MSDYSRRRLLVAALALAGVSAIGCGESCSCEAPRPEPADVTIYIVRHAEKQQLPEDAPEAERKDPPLSRDGQVRAMGLTEDVPVRDISAIYVTKTRRSNDTASAVVALNGVKPIIYPPADTDGLVERLRKRHGQHVLVVGHSNTIPLLLAGLGVPEAVEIDEAQYGDMWVVTLNGAGATVELRRFGESVERFDPGR
ncbi:histidine phosphatase family protein [Enhygromyxa salina]|uniref:Histidine phosphatase superfamily n=1 Tax=Enhygromyxa salina TaxID=215803 RepID=A0A2S9YVR6_9BACT|nr:phosphoglycerate mutase family protein [Enhygromyxa salina]PRQ09198.1 Histidine phosphatase superfamily [Enhygromyxa salina]